MNSFFGTTVGRPRQPHFRHYLVSEPATHQQCTSRFAELGIWTPTYCGLLKQPDNQKPPTSTRPPQAFPGTASEYAYRSIGRRSYLRDRRQKSWEFPQCERTCLSCCEDQE